MSSWSVEHASVINTKFTVILHYNEIIKFHKVHQVLAYFVFANIKLTIFTMNIYCKMAADKDKGQLCTQKVEIPHIEKKLNLVLMNSDIIYETLQMKKVFFSDSLYRLDVDFSGDIVIAHDMLLNVESSKLEHQLSSKLWKSLIHHIITTLKKKSKKLQSSKLR